jgi:hypothetical protein
MMALVEHQDRPPRKREPLPTKEQIAAIADVPALEALEAEVDKRAKKIEVDLEFEVGDDEWDGRARGALTAHRICLGHVRKRLHWLRTREKPETVTTSEVLAAKAEKARANAEKQKAFAAATEAQRANKVAKLQAARLDLIDRTTFQGHFMRAAAKVLDAETYDRILAMAQERHAAAIASQVIVPNGSSKADGETKE